MTAHTKAALVTVGSYLLVVLVVLSIVWTVFAPPADAHHKDDHDGGPAEKVTICHAAGLADEPANWVEIEVSANANNGHFDENGTPLAGHEQDFFGPCPTVPDEEEPEEPVTTTNPPEISTTVSVERTEIPYDQLPPEPVEEVVTVETVVEEEITVATLPFTGADTTSLAGLAAILLAAGGMTLALGAKGNETTQRL